MDEENKVVQDTIAPQEPKTETAPEVVEDANVQETDTQSASETDVEDSTSGESQSSSTVPTWEHEKKSMSGKISQLERERNELAQRAKLVEALDVAAANDPEFMRIANKKLVEQGLLDESVLAELENMPQQARPADGGFIDPAVKWAQQKMQEERLSQEKFFEDFETRHPDIAEGDSEQARVRRRAISTAAQLRMANGESQKDAYEYAYRQMLHPEQLVEEGKLQGMVQAQSATPAEGAASGGAANTGGVVNLTPEQKAAARSFGLTEEAYAKSLEE